ncbi:phosphoserine transaminase [Schaalia sp. lx-100]|uniref:phosphoserine transaminase n=1 Tax=Schaalia sp. lx-100 TaxID=2899081 RepID=UPI001E384D81|nr:phosphoserine transaminase [Schaalia sp. lx-100]MCD4557606.1 phosphoserine transaminase [Schaalia sp. lx-100]
MTVTLPADILPSDGRFGCGPSRIFPQHIQAINDSGLMGTSHRQAPVKNLVASVRAGIRELYALPDGWEVVLGNGGATAFWAIATTSLVQQQACHGVFGEFGSKFAAETQAAPHLTPSIIVEAPAGHVALLSGHEKSDSPAGLHADFVAPDVFAHPHHETSTGALSPIRRIGNNEQLLLVDATSIAGGINVDVTLCDAYYFAPQKCFASDGGLWIALLSPAAQKRAHELHAASDRWMPQFLDLSLAINNSVKDQTLNTPALATLIMLDQQIQWMLAEGGLEAMEKRSRAASQVLYNWAENSEGLITPFVQKEEWRSPVVVTLDFNDSLSAGHIARILRDNGVVDVEPYRSLGRNQLRIATFPSTSVADVEALVACITYIIEGM